MKKLGKATICDICGCAGNCYIYKVDSEYVSLCDDCIREFYEEEFESDYEDFFDIKKEVKKTATGAWQSGLNVVDVSDVKIHVDVTLVAVVRAVEKKVSSGKEFSILAKGKWNGSGFYVSSEYVIPKQEVSHAEVNFKENLHPYIQEGFNVVIHKHPSGLREFSHSDEESINSNFDCSLLWTDSEFVNATLKVKLNDNIHLRLRPKVIVDYPEVEVDVSNISEKTYSHSYLDLFEKSSGNKKKDGIIFLKRERR